MRTHTHTHTHTHTERQRTETENRDREQRERQRTERQRQRTERQRQRVPRITTQPQQSTNNPHWWLQELSNGSNSQWHLRNQYVTLSQPTYPLTRGTHLLIKIFSHMESPKGLLQAPLEQCFPTFHYGTFFFFWLTIFSSLEPFIRFQ